MKLELMEAPGSILGPKGKINLKRKMIDMLCQIRKH